MIRSGNALQALTLCKATHGCLHDDDDDDDKNSHACGNNEMPNAIIGMFVEAEAQIWKAFNLTSWTLTLNLVSAID